MIELIVNGTPYTDFSDASVTEAIESMANDFSFTASAVKIFPPFKQNDSVVVIVDGETKLTGYIDEVNGSDQEGSHAVTYTGRDKTGDLIDSKINVIDELRPNSTLTLKRIIEIVIEHLGLDIQVIDDVEPKSFNVTEDRINPQVGQDALEFLMSLAKKRQVLLTSNGDGNIVITQSNPSDSGATLQRIQGSDNNNIISQSWTVNASQVFNKYIHRGQLDPRALNFAGTSGVASVENQGAEVVYSGAREGRQQVVVESASYSSDELKDRAKWASQLALARAVVFNCVAKGHRDENDILWKSNILVQINSDVADITRKMLISSLTFSQGEGRPTITSFKFVEENVYTIDEKLLASKKTGKQSDAFSNLG